MFHDVIPLVLTKAILFLSLWFSNLFRIKFQTEILSGIFTGDNLLLMVSVTVNVCH